MAAGSRAGPLPGSPLAGIPKNPWINPPGSWLYLSGVHKRANEGRARGNRGKRRIQRHLRTLFDVGTVAGLTDGQLLERFASRRDETAELAFAALVERHGPMVLRVSRGILHDEHEALDVLQATFLVLARKGGRSGSGTRSGPGCTGWLAGSRDEPRKAADRRRTLETRWAVIADARGGADDRGDGKELAAVVHEEVDRLPERYRAPVVLCDLEEYTCEATARHLGCPVGTVASRLARGRQRLRDRLRRRGLAPDASLLASALRWQGRGQRFRLNSRARRPAPRFNSFRSGRPPRARPQSLRRRSSAPCP